MRYKPVAIDYGTNESLTITNAQASDSGFYYVVGMCQGMFVIETDVETGKQTAVQQGGAALADVDKDGVIRILGPQTPASMPLWKLIKRVKKAVKLKKPFKLPEVKP